MNKVARPASEGLRRGDRIIYDEANSTLTIIGEDLNEIRWPDNNSDKIYFFGDILGMLQIVSRLFGLNVARDESIVERKKIYRLI